MPVKKGANGKMRHYNPNNGRYIKENSFIILNTKNKKSKYEKELDRRRILAEKAQNSKDPFLYDIFSALEKQNPGCIIRVNERISNKKTSMVDGEIDIETKKSIIEIKSSTAQKSSKQFVWLNNYANSNNKKLIIYAPNMPYGAEKYYTKIGYTIIRNIHDLLIEERR